MISRYYPIDGATASLFGANPHAKDGTPRRPGAVCKHRPMRAATIRDGEIAVAEHPDPEPQSGELLVAVKAAGLNGADMHQLAGGYPAPPGAPQDIPGLEMAGEVVALGRGVTRFEIGDRVMAVIAGGGQAELAVVHERAAMPVPDELDWTAAGGVPEAFTTAHDALFTQAELAVGERLLVHGAAGGVGMAAVQLGAMAGARVTATVRDAAAREQIAALGVLALEPGGLRGPRPVRRDPRAGRRAEPRREHAGAGAARPDQHHRRGRRARRRSSTCSR